MIRTSNRCFSQVFFYTGEEAKGSEAWYMDDLRLLDMIAEKTVEKLCFLNWVVFFLINCSVYYSGWPFQHRKFSSGFVTETTVWCLTIFMERLGKTILSMENLKKDSFNAFSKKKSHFCPKLFLHKNKSEICLFFFRGLTYLVPKNIGRSWVPGVPLSQEVAGRNGAKVTGFHLGAAGVGVLIGKTGSNRGRVVENPRKLGNGLEKEVFFISKTFEKI